MFSYFKKHNNSQRILCKIFGCIKSRMSEIRFSAVSLTARQPVSDASWCPVSRCLTRFWAWPVLLWSRGWQLGVPIKNAADKEVPGRHGHSFARTEVFQPEDKFTNLNMYWRHWGRCCGLVVPATAWDSHTQALDPSTCPYVRGRVRGVLGSKLLWVFEGDPMIVEPSLSPVTLPFRWSNLWEKKR